MKLYRTVIWILFAALLATGISGEIFGQQSEYLEDEGESLWEEEMYMEASGADFETQEGKYMSEEEIQLAEEEAIKAGVPTLDLAAAIDQDKEMMPDNIMYGVGTGAMLGVWLAFSMGEADREQAKYVTVGILSGGLLGVFLGTKSILMPQSTGASNLPRREYPSDPGIHDGFPAYKSRLASRIKNSPLQLNFQFKF